MFQNLVLKNWWILAVQGLLAILFGVVMVIWPAITVQVLVLLFGVYCLIDGISTLVSGLIIRNVLSRWWMTAINGLVSILAGIVVLLWPGITSAVLMTIMGIWAVGMGIFRIGNGIFLVREVRGEGWFALSGIISILFGAAVIAVPNAGAVALVSLISVYVILSGVISVSASLLLHRISRIFCSRTIQVV